jgi:hypothetical protein
VFWLLPWTLLFAYAPLDGVPRPGLKIVSKFYWAQPKTAPRGWIVRQQDDFELGSIVRSVFALPIAIAMRMALFLLGRRRP